MATKKKATRRARPVGDNRKVEQKAVSSEARPKNTKERRPRRQQRTSVGGWRNVLTIEWKDEAAGREYVTRWVKDIDESGHACKHFFDHDWDFVTSDEVNVGENFVQQAGKLGSIVRVPAGRSTEDAKHSLYLMKKYKDWYEGDMKDKLSEVDKVEEYINRERDPSKVENEGEGHATKGLYGGAKTRWEKAPAS